MMTQSRRVYIGTYTGKGSDGVYVLDFDAERGTLSPPRLAGRAENPSFVALHPSGRWLYTVGEVAEFKGQAGGSVAAYSVDEATGTLTLLNRVPSGGEAPCYVEVDPTGRAVLVANYTGGSVAAFPVGDDGSLSPTGSLQQHTGSGPDPKRQKGPHAHSIRVDPSGRYALAADLGLDRVVAYRLDAAKATLAHHEAGDASSPAGGGPRHQAWHPNDRWLYVLNELHATVTRFDWEPAEGRLQPRETVSALPEGYDGTNTGAEVAAHPSGRFVYASNRGHDSIAGFAVDAATGALTPIGHTPSGGKGPRHFSIHPSGRWLLAANQNSNSLVLFAIDERTGALTDTGAGATVSMPVCVCFG